LSSTGFLGVAGPCKILWIAEVARGPSFIGALGLDGEMVVLVVAAGVADAIVDPSFAGALGLGGGETVVGVSSGPRFADVLDLGATTLGGGGTDCAVGVIFLIGLPS